MLAARHSNDSMCQYSLQKLSTIIYPTNQAMIPESGITRRRQSKNVHSLPFFLSRPHTALFFFSPYTPLGSLFTGCFKPIRLIRKSRYTETWSLVSFCLLSYELLPSHLARASQKALGSRKLKIIYAT